MDVSTIIFTAIISTTFVIIIYLLRDSIKTILFKHGNNKFQITAYEPKPTIGIDNVMTSEVASGNQHKYELHEFTINSIFCSSLNLIGQQSEISGKKIQYLENDSISEYCVIFLHGLGLDHNDFRLVLANADYHAFAPSLYGFERGATTSLSLGYRQHIAIIEEFIKEVTNQYHKIILVGFSIGGDMALDLAANSDILKNRIIGLVTLDCNLDINTCDISRAFTLLPPEQKALLKYLKTIGLQEEGEDIDSISVILRWAYFQEYLAKVFTKFHNRTHILTSMACDIIKNHENKEKNYFITNVASALDKRYRLSLLFTNSNENKNALIEVKKKNIANKVFGRYYTDDIIKEEEWSHFELLEPNLINSQIQQIVDYKMYNPIS